MELAEYEDKNHLPLFSNFKPDNVVSNTKTLIEQLENDFDRLEEKMKMHEQIIMRYQ